MQIQQTLFPLPWALNIMETIDSYGGRIDPDGYQWPPTFRDNRVSKILKDIFLAELIFFSAESPIFLAEKCFSQTFERQIEQQSDNALNFRIQF